MLLFEGIKCSTTIIFNTRVRLKDIDKIIIIILLSALRRYENIEMARICFIITIYVL